MKHRFLQIDTDDTLVRDSKTNAVLNTDMTALQKYKVVRDKERQMREDIDNLKTDMSEIKQLLQQLVNRD